MDRSSWLNIGIHSVLSSVKIYQQEIEPQHMRSDRIRAPRAKVTFANSPFIAHCAFPIFVADILAILFAIR